MAAMDDDFDLMLDDIDFDLDGSSSKKSTKPKNIVFSTGLDALDAMKDSFDPRGKVKDIVRELMPSAVRSEYSDLESAMDEIKDEMDKSTEKMKDVLKDVSGAFADFLPEGKMKNKLKDFAKKEGYVDDGYKKTKEEEENERIKQALLEAMGENATEERNAAMVKQAMDEKREANSQLVLKHVYAELKVMNNFNTRITNKYYTKSLELQYRNLYKMTELVELTKVGWEANRKQVESLLINSSLPDVIKLKALQAANDPRLKERAKRSYLGTYFKRFNPFENLKNNIIKNIREQTQGFTSGFEALLQGKQALDDIRNAGMGLGPGMFLGSMLGDWIRSNTLGWVGNKLGATKQGKRGIFAFKEMMGDPRAFFNSLKEKEDGSTMASRWKRRGFDAIARLTGAPNKNRVDFINENLDDAKVFDGRAHQAIVKVIPGLLSNIYGAIKSGMRVTDDQVKANAIYYDNRTGGFVTRQGMARNLNRKLKSVMNKDGYKRNLESLFREYNGGEWGAADVFTEQEKRKISGAMAKYLMSPYNSGINVGVLTSEDFLKNFSGKLRDKLAAKGAVLRDRASNDWTVHESVMGALRGIRESLPNLNDDLQDMFKSGHMDIARGMKLVRQGPDGRYRVNETGVDRAIMSTAGGIDFGTEEQQQERPQTWRDRWNNFWSSEEGSSLRSDMGNIPGVGAIVGFGNRLRNTNTFRAGAGLFNMGRNVLRRGRNAITSRVESLANFLDQDEEVIVEQISNKKAKIESVLSPDSLRSLPSRAISTLRSSFNSAQDAASKAMKDIDKKLTDVQALGMSGTTAAVGEQASKVYADAKKQISKLSVALVEDLNTLGLPPDKIKARLDQYKTQVKDIQAEAEQKVRNNPQMQAIFASGGVASVVKATKVGGGIKGIFGKLGKIGGIFGFGGSGESAMADDVMVGNQRLAKQEMKEKLEAERTGSAQNRMEKYKKDLLADDKNLNKKSSFLGKGMVKKLAIGGIGFLAISLLQKMGIGLEDLIGFGRGILGALVETGKFLIPVVKTIGTVLGKVGSAIGWVASKFGWTDDDPENKKDDSGGSAGSALGKLAVYGGLAYGGYRAAKWGLGVGRTVAAGVSGAGKLLGLYGAGVQAGAKVTQAAAGAGAKAAGKGLLRGAGRFLTRKALPLMGAYGLATGIGREDYTMLDAGLDAMMLAPGKVLNKGKDLFMRLYSWFANKPGGQLLTRFLSAAKKVIMGPLEKLSNTWNNSKSKIGYLKKALSKPKVIKRIGAKIIGKAMAKIATLAIAVTGIGAIISLATWAWDLVKILSGWLWDKLSFESAVSKQLLGVDLFDPKEKEALEIDENEETEKAEKIEQKEEETQKKEEKKEEQKIQKKEYIEPKVSPITTASNNGSMNVEMLPDGKIKATKNGTTMYFDKNMNYLGTDDTSIKKVSYNPDSGGVNNPKQVKPNFDFSKYNPPKYFQYTDIGSVSGWFESKNRPATVSSGAGDYGGVSYGTWQLASRNGRVQEYLKTSRYRNEFAGMAVNSPEFKAKWQEIGMRDPEGFQKDQEAFIRRTHYDITERNLRGIGLDLSKRSDALKAAVFSTSVHYGPSGATRSITNAIFKAGLDPKTASDEEIINAIYDYKMGTIDIKFKSSSASVRDGIRNRFVQEKGMIMSLLGSLPAPKVQTDNVANNEPSSGSVPTETTESPVSPRVERSAPSLQQTTASVDSGKPVSTTFNTNTTVGLGPVQDVLNRSLKVQEKMLKSLVEIAANTAIFATAGKQQQEQQQSKSTFIPQPVISLDRRERFDI